MLDRGVIREFLSWELEDTDVELPQDVSMNELVETFCLYVEDDYYEWLKDNFRSFFRHDKNWIKEQVKKH